MNQSNELISKLDISSMQSLTNTNLSLQNVEEAKQSIEHKCNFSDVCTCANNVSEETKLLPQNTTPILSLKKSEINSRDRTTSELSCDSSRVEELRDAVTSRIRELELDNQRIKAEKNNLRNQLRRMCSRFMSVASSATVQQTFQPLINKDIISNDNDVDVTEFIRISLADLSSNEFPSSGSSSPEAPEHHIPPEGITASLASTPGSIENANDYAVVKKEKNPHSTSTLHEMHSSNSKFDKNQTYQEIESQRESQYAVLPSQIPPKVTITRKRFVPSSFRLSYPTSSTSNSSDNYGSFPRQNKTNTKFDTVNSDTEKIYANVPNSCNLSYSLDLVTCSHVSRPFPIPILKQADIPLCKYREHHNSLSFLNSSDGRETLFPLSKESSSQFLTNSSIHLLADYKPHHINQTTPCTSNLANRLSGLVNSLAVYTCVKGKARLVQTQSTQEEHGMTDSEDTTSECDFFILTNRKKKENCGHSVGNELCTVESENSMDYYSPPDETSISSTTQSDVRSLANALLPGKKVFKSGPISELCRKFKLWRQQWAILTSRGIFFYSTKPKENERPSQCVSLSDIVSIHRLYQQQTADQCISFELVTDKKTYTFSAISTWETNLWIKVLRKAFKRSKADLMVQKFSSQLLHKGFLKRVKCGYSSKLWCVLLGSNLVYYRTSAEINPSGYRNISACRLRSAGECSKTTNTVCDSSDSDSDTADIPNKSRTLALWEEMKNPVYFVCATDQNYDKWHHYLSLVCAPNTPVDNITLMTNVVNEKYHNNFFHSREVISVPVSQTLDPSMMSLAIELFNFLLRVSYPFARTDIDTKYEKVRLFQEIARMCYTNPGLKDELFLQLIRQSRSAPKDAKPKRSKLSLFCRSPSKDVAVGSRRLLNDKQALIGMWEGLCLLLPLFLPSPPILSFLEVYLASRRDNITDTGKYATFCSDALSRVRDMGGRRDVPSFFEIKTISIRHPYTHQQPFSIPIHLNSGAYHVVSFDATTSVDELCQTMHVTCFSNFNFLEKKEHSKRMYCTFGLYIKGDSGSFLFLDPTWKVCDIISRFESSLLDQDSSVNLDEVSIELHFRIRGFELNLFVLSESPRYSVLSNEDFLRLLVHQLHQDVKRGYYLLCGSEILDLVALLCQGEHSDYLTIQNKDATLNRLVHKHFPTSLTDQVEKVMHLKLLLMSRWSSLRGRIPCDVFLDYITRLERMCSNHFTANPFLCRCVNGGDIVATFDWLFLALRFDRLSILNPMTSTTLKSVNLQSIVSFGGRGKSFFLVFSDIENGEEILRRLNFILTDLSAILELTCTLSDYINIK